MYAICPPSSRISYQSSNVSVIITGSPGCKTARMAQLVDAQARTLTACVALTMPDEADTLSGWDAMGGLLRLDSVSVISNSTASPFVQSMQLTTIIQYMPKPGSSTSSKPSVRCV